MIRAVYSLALLQVSQDILDEVTGVFSLLTGRERKAIVKSEIGVIGFCPTKGLNLNRPITLNG